MAKVPFKLPNVFVGCPYSSPFNYGGFQKALNNIPMRFHYADTSLTTKHLLSILRTYIRAADFCLFDVSTWNPNVALELGLADGIGASYYILLDRKKKKGVPADLQGIQRIEYEDFDDLTDQIHRYLLLKETYPRKIQKSFKGTATDRKPKIHLAMRILAHFRDNKGLSHSDLSSLAKGTYLRNDRQEEALEALENLGIVRGFWGKKDATLKKSLYKEPIRVAAR